MKDQETYTIVTTIRGDGSYENVPDIPRISKENQGKFVAVFGYLLVPLGYNDAAESYFSRTVDGHGRSTGYSLTPEDLSITCKAERGSLVVYRDFTSIIPEIKYHTVCGVVGRVDADVIDKIKNFVEIMRTTVNVFPV